MERPTPRLDTKDETFGARIVAFLIDGLVLGVLGAVLLGIMATIDPLLTSLLGTIYGLGAILYFIYFEGAYGQTLGKRAMGIVVVKTDGGDTDMAASVIRNLLRIIDTLPTLYILGIILILVTDDNQRLGDIVGNTVVVRTA